MAIASFMALALSAMLWADSSRIVWMLLGSLCALLMTSRYGYRVALLTLLLIVVVLAIAQSKSISPASTLNPSLHRVVVSLPVIVDGVPERIDDRMRLRVVQTDPTFPRRIVVSGTTTDGDFTAGDCWHLTLRLRRVNSLTNPGGFDRQQWLREQRIGAFADIVRPSQNTRCVQQKIPLRWQAANTIHRSIDKAGLPAAAAGLLPAMITGERAGIPTHTADLLRRSGTAHLLSISGLHIGLAAAFGLFLGRYWPAGRWGVRQDRAVLLGWVFAGLYAALSGFALPAQRAWIMFTLMALATLSRRPVDVAESLMLATLFVLATDSQRVVGISFNLSFSAVATLALAQRIAIASARKHNSWLHRLTFAQLLLSMSLIPIAILWFGYWSYVGLIANLLMVPIFSLVIIPSAFVAALTALIFEPLSLPIWRAIGWLITQVLELLTYATVSLGATVPAMAISSATAAALMATISLCLLTRQWPGRALALCACFCLFFWRAKSPDFGCVELTMLDVGHGSALHWQTAHQNGLYDTGPAWRSGGDAGQAVVVPYLRWSGLDALDLAVVSHADADHAGGYVAVDAAISVTRWLDSDAALGLACRQGQRWHSAGVDFAVLWPPAADVSAMPSHWNENERSCVVRISTGNSSVLLTGDIEHRAERELVAMGIPTATLLTAPHHGSRTSSTPSFVSHSKAQWVWVSAAADGRWEMPNPAVADRWLKAGANLALTASSGALRARLCAPDSLQVSAYRRPREAFDLW